MNTSSFSKQARGNDPGVIKNQEFVTAKKVWKPRKIGVGTRAADPINK
jgi:hypothetical protein